MGAFYTYLLKKGYWLSIPVPHYVSRKKKNPNLAKIKCLQSVTNSLPF